jgi:hypothetical protein
MLFALLGFLNVPTALEAISPRTVSYLRVSQLHVIIDVDYRLSTLFSPCLVWRFQAHCIIFKQLSLNCSIIDHYRGDHHGPTKATQPIRGDVTRRDTRSRSNGPGRLTALNLGQSNIDGTL